MTRQAWPRHDERGRSTPQRVGALPSGRARRPAAPRRWPRVAAELVVAPVVAVGVTAAVVAVVAALRIPAGTNVALALTASGGAVLAALLLGAAWLHRRAPAVATPLSWAALAALPTLPLALFLSATPHYLFGVSGDQSFRVEFLTRFADSARLADFAYADLPPYYPAVWFWVGGRTADLLGVGAWAFHKPYALATLAVTSVLAYVLWSLVTTRPRALALATATTFAGLATTAAYTPYSWLTGALLPPVAVLGLRLVRRGNGTWVRTAALVGLVLGLAAVTHTQMLWFGGFVLAVLAADGLLTRRTGPARPAGPVAVVLGVTVVVALVHWLPYLAGSLGGGPTYSAGQHFLPSNGSKWTLPMLDPTALGALCLAGTLWIAWRFRSSEIARALGVTVACSYAWYLCSTAALALGTTLLAFRIEPVLTAALACGAVGAAADALRLLRERGSGPQAATVVTVLAAVAVVAQVQAVPQQYAFASGAQNDYRPDGTRPDGSRNPADAGAWLGDLRTTIDGLTGRPPRQVVVLSANVPLLSYTPYFSYQVSVPPYANPRANFPARTDAIRRWAAAPGPRELLADLDASAAAGTGRPPSVFVLERRGDGSLQVPTSQDRFPSTGTGAAPAVFPARLFEDPAWQRRDVGPFTVLVRADAPPVP
ncbi:arabinofuranosyltransferase [Pseudonocardia phyllosphaerae]|uniref:arabinofuranosyltransferase n=1 Tax=Pseudonocardia phyllosphaerae TaxID=3390502 RepID=UPI00397A4C09